MAPKHDRHVDGMATPPSVAIENHAELIASDSDENKSSGDSKRFNFKRRRVLERFDAPENPHTSSRVMIYILHISLSERWSASLASISRKVTINHAPGEKTPALSRKESSVNKTMSDVAGRSGGITAAARSAAADFGDEIMLRRPIEYSCRPPAAAAAPRARGAALNAERKRRGWANSLVCGISPFSRPTFTEEKQCGTVGRDVSLRAEASQADRRACPLAAKADNSSVVRALCRDTPSSIGKSSRCEYRSLLARWLCLHVSVLFTFPSISAVHLSIKINA